MNRRRHIKGRGSVSNPSGRFEAQLREAVDDGWSGDDDPDAERPRTEIFQDAARSVITRNQSPDVPFDQSINPYRGCEHGCIYCFARPSHAYLGLSPGLDFETKIFSKPNAAELLTRELGRASYRPEPIALGVNTDPYQQVERSLGITRAILEVLARHRHPVSILTKSDLILRDLDILGSMAERRLVSVNVSITTLDPQLCKRMEPRAGMPRRRLAAVAGLSGAGVPTGVLAAPMIPALNDHELEQILEASAAAGATRAGTILLRLPLELKELFSQWLHANYPLRAKRVLKLIRDTRNGGLNHATFGVRMRGTGAYADLLQARYRKAIARFGLTKAWPPLDTSAFRRPERDPRQLPLF